MTDIDVSAAIRKGMLEAPASSSSHFFAVALHSLLKGSGKGFVWQRQGLRRLKLQQLQQQLQLLVHAMT